MGGPAPASAAASRRLAVGGVLRGEPLAAPCACGSSDGQRRRARSPSSAEAGRDVAGQRQIAREAAHGRRREQRIGAELDHAAAGGQLVAQGDPGRQRVQRPARDRPRPGRPPGSKPACIGWSTGSEMRDGQNSTTGRAKRWAKSARASKPAANAPARWRQRAAAARRAAISAAASSMRGRRRHRRWRSARWRGILGSVEAVDRAAQHLARQRQVDRPHGRAHGDRQRPVDQLGHLLGQAQLVVPLHQLAHHGALVAHLLAPVDRQVARAGPAALAGRRAAGQQQQRDVVARGVDHAHDRVGEADIDVDHHRLRPAGGEPVAVRHGDRGRFVRDDERRRAWRGPPTGARARPSISGAKSVPALANR